MRISSIFVFLSALGLAVLSGFMAQNWLERQRIIAPAPASPPQTQMAKIVVASAPLRFGSALSAANIREIDWPSNAIPTGAFRSVADLLKANERRVALSAIEANEPIMQWKVTGPGQRGTLSALIDPNAKAMTIRVNDVTGAAGFVLPSDRVDVLLTRSEERSNVRGERSVGAGETRKVTFTDVLLQNVRVLGIDQVADDRSVNATVVKAVTLEVTTADAQRLALASTVGSLSLALRPAGSSETVAAFRVTTASLGNDDEDATFMRPTTASAEAQPKVPVAIEPPPAERGVSFAKMGVVRGVVVSPYDVIRERRRP